MGQNDPRDVTPERIVSEQVSEAPRSPVALDRVFVRRLTKGSTTPSVNNTEVCIAQNTGAVLVTDFLEGAEGQHLFILGDGFTTVEDNTNILPNTGGDKLLQADQFYHFIHYSGVWIEISGASSGAGVDSFNGRTGVVVPLQADYDAFFLTPAEGAAAFAAIVHTHAASDIVSGTMAQARLGTGSGGAGAKFLADDQTYKTPGTVLSGNFVPTQRACLFILGNGAGVDSFNGAAPSLTGTASEPAVADTNHLTRERRTRITSGVAANNGSIVRVLNGANGLFMSKIGFKFRTIFGLETNVNGHRCFLGLCNTTTPVASDPSALVDAVGIGFDAGDSNAGNWQLFNNDGSGGATKTDTGVPRNTTTLYALELSSDDGTSITVRIIDLSSGTAVYTTTLSTNLPTTTVGLAPFYATNILATASASQICFTHIYCEYGYSW